MKRHGQVMKYPEICNKSALLQSHFCVQVQNSNFIIN
jgi:hypothetical protein